MILRPYQVQAVATLRTRIREGKRRLVLVAPCGSGKTVMASEIIRGAVAKGKRAVMIAHRKELIDQTVDKITRFGVASGVLMGNDARRDDWLPTQVCSIQTLVRRDKPPADIVIIDECHHSLSNSYREVLKSYPDAIVFGLTATPFRTDKKGLSDLYEDHVIAATIPELLAIGALVPCESYAYNAPELHDVKIIAGEYSNKDLEIACNTNVLVGSAVKEYLQHTPGKRAIVFPVNVTHSKTVVAEFCAAGVRAKHLDCHTPKREREKILADLDSGEITVVSSVGVLSEGFDSPRSEVCILLRPTKSLSLQMQMCGRVMRPAEGKTKAIIQDHAGNLLRHGLFDDDRNYSLTATPERTRLLLTCPFCYAVQGFTKEGKCRVCGQLIASPADPKSSTPSVRNQKEVVEGLRISAEEIRAMRERGVRSDLTDHQLARAKNATTEEKRAEYLRLKQVVEKKQFKPGFAKHQFRACFGHWPNYSDEQLQGITPATKPFFPLPKKEKEPENQTNLFVDTNNLQER